MHAVVLGSLLLALPPPSAQGVVPVTQTLDWMSGHWCARLGQDHIDEVWLPAVGDSLHGLSRTVRAGRVVGFEFMRVELRDGVQTFFAQPQGREATAFQRVEGGPGWVRFGNQAHDFPNVIVYRRDGDALQATIEGPGADGEQMQIAFAYRRCQSMADKGSAD